MKEVVECSKELVHLPHGKACLQCIVEGVKPTASNINQMSTIQLSMLSLEEVCKLQVDIWAVHTDGEKLPQYLTILTILQHIPENKHKYINGNIPFMFFFEYTGIQ